MTPGRNRRGGDKRPPCIRLARRGSFGCMAAIRTLKNRTALMPLLGEVRYTLSRAMANPIAAPLVPVFQAIRDKWTTVQAKEIACTEAISDAQALIDQADDDLDDFASKLSKAILTITKDDTSHSLFTHFFLGKTLREHCKPILNKQLATQTDWIGSLQASPYPELKAMAPELIKLVQAANDAVAARDKAFQENKTFREIGERQQFVDHLNAERKAGFGTLGKISESSPGLAADFPNRFFKVLEDDAEPPPTIKSVKKKIDELKIQLADEEGLLKKLEKEAADAAADAEKQQKKKARRAELEEQREALDKQIEDLDKE